MTARVSRQRRSRPPTLANSIARLLDVYGFMGIPESPGPREAMYQDWALAGDDLRAALEYYADELTREQRVSEEEREQLLVEV